MGLWTLAEQQMIRPIDSNSLTKFEMLQQEVEINDLQKMIGRSMYQELVRNSDNYGMLLNGGSYTHNGMEYYFNGLKFVCSYLLYARYVRQSAMIDTFSGFVRHTDDNMQHIGAGELQNQENRYKEVAGTAWDECREYISAMGYDFENCSLINRKIKIDYL